MPLSEITRKFARHSQQRLHQGDIFREIEFQTEVTTDEGAIFVSSRIEGFCVVVTQDCDLEHDAGAHQSSDSQASDKFLDSILLCPAYRADQLRDGVHLQPLGLHAARFDTKRWKVVAQNNNPRYHVLFEEQDFQIPQLAIDFKRYFAIPRDSCYEASKGGAYLGTISALYRDHLSHRFAFFLSRIGLPEAMIESDTTPVSSPNR